MAPPCAMKIRYFPDTNTLCIELADRVSLLPITPVHQPA
jgi:hypothetical protein